MLLQDEHRKDPSNQAEIVFGLFDQQLHHRASGVSTPPSWVVGQGGGSSLTWKTALEALVAQNGRQRIEYSLEESGPDDNKRYDVVCSIGKIPFGNGSSNTVKGAEERASELSFYYYEVLLCVLRVLRIFDFFLWLTFFPMFVSSSRLRSTRRHVLTLCNNKSWALQPPQGPTFRRHLVF